MGGMEVAMGELFGGKYKGKRVLVTGHCGFKGSWCCLWLKKLGAEVVGYGHPPRTQPSHWNLLRPVEYRFGTEDLLDYRQLRAVVMTFKPDLIIHLAAKAIVARTFTEPRETFENNVMGAVNILEAARLCPSVKGVVMITTDKVYEDREWMWGYRENDELGGKLPYDASKVCVEQVIRCYRESFGMNIATARAGNVIGGGDWSEKRLIPDIVRAASRGEETIIHTPNATRPWQHVLEPLQGYLLLGAKILQGENVSKAWNFGPEGEMTVEEVLQTANLVWDKVKWRVDGTPTHPGMIYLLKIDSTEAKKELGWRPVWDMAHAVMMSILWYKIYYEQGILMSHLDLRDYESSWEESYA